ncbi:amino ABC transporter, permease, 3-TM region, His/Glu/Gln/Arg/opine family domain protein (plasmid) [Ochrobactrum quorumnocens]|uniref:Glutamate/aspartate import permease protein GltK n=2 Tax=Ochrobactrum quorumnocens TaxID=271865 RepID=A0A248UNL8_9HYPH|nr:amino acid ABC transporter permease [[Ochrobactrum] quorumnocens]ASV87991.1 amino ABC transporter, permease, 3-TM region, His/Glu/Gln/Arg/opine family domain protein [[Ochrobactrum] quorumnocens]
MSDDSNLALSSSPDRPMLTYVPASAWKTRIAATLLIILILYCVQKIAANPNFGWSVVGEYLFDSRILWGLSLTLWLTVVTMVIGVVLGTIFAIMAMSNNVVISKVASAYIWFFRGTPVLVQLIFWYNLGALFPEMSIGLPFTSWWISVSTNSLISPVTAAVLGLGLNEGAYMSEIIRSGLMSVEPGQKQAAKSLGMTNSKTLWRIILPQAMPVIIPPTGNQTIGMLKTSSLVSVISLADLLYSAQTIYSRNFQTIPLLIVACIWYLAATTILSALQVRIERHFGRSNQQANTPIRRLFRQKAQ